MSARSLDELLPQRAAIRWICVRRWLRPRALAAIEGLGRAWSKAAPWLAGAAVVLAYLLVCAWIDRRDAVADASVAFKAVAFLQQENRSLRSRLVQRDMTSTRNLFYVVEGETLDEAATKLQRLSLAIAGDAYDMKTAAKEQTK